MITVGEKARKTHIVVDDRKGNVGVAAAPSAASPASKAAAVDDGKWRPTTLVSASAEQKRQMLHSLLDEGTTKIKIAHEAEGAAGATAKGAAGKASRCVECEEAAATVSCVQCTDIYCNVCFASMHRKGKRLHHQKKPLVQDAKVASTASAAVGVKPLDATAATAAVTGSSSSAAASGSGGRDSKGMSDDDDDAADDELLQAARDSDLANFKYVIMPSNYASNLDSEYFVERARYCPVRLTLPERKLLRLVEACMNVSEYTDKIDAISAKEKAKRILETVRNVCAMLTGLQLAHDYTEGQTMMEEKDFSVKSAFFQDLFEICRRHKIRNPEKMRSAYGKLLYFLQDSMDPNVQELLDFKCVKPIKTVYTTLKAADAVDMLRDPIITVATREIQAEGKSRSVIDREVREKVAAIQRLARHYENSKIGYEDLRMCLLSIGDNHSYLRCNRDPCDRLITYLTTMFSPDEFKENFSLAIVGGNGGARLTHSHKLQYHYVLQSLMLWREILHDMFKLWCLMEEDLLSDKTPYSLMDTGQGLQRVQQSPRIAKCIRTILHHCQSKINANAANSSAAAAASSAGSGGSGTAAAGGSAAAGAAAGWVGSSVIHLGDKNVPNALMFIDKYNQVARILNPVVITLRAIDRLYEDAQIQAYIDHAWGGADSCRMAILTDFFRSAFDGSGADNFFDAGSCIDGRLTSAWHWCSQIQKKPFYPIFLLAGFTSFDGEF